MVQINEQHVGYLEKEIAASYLSVVREVWDAGYVAATGARIWASARDSWDSHPKLKYVARVSLALAEPHLLLPVNDPPTEDYSILPWGSALQLSGEEQHQELDRTGVVSAKRLSVRVDCGGSRILKQTKTCTILLT